MHHENQTNYKPLNTYLVMANYTMLNLDSVTEMLEGVIYDAVSERAKCMYESLIDEYITMHAQKIVDDMEKYVRQADTKIVGNFNDITRDWNMRDNAGTDYTPSGWFADIVAAMEKGEIDESEAEKVQEWTLSWFLETFGTFGIKYNFNEFLDSVQYDTEYNDLDEMDDLRGLTLEQALDEIDRFVIGLDRTDINEDDSPIVIYSDLWRFEFTLDDEGKVLTYKHE